MMGLRLRLARLWRRICAQWAAWRRQCAAWRARRAGAKGRLRRWLVQRFLPMWAKETILAENERLRAQLAESRAECERLRCYARGLERGLRAVRGPRVRAETNRRPPEQ